MVAFLITGHGEFASGIVSGIKVIAGEQPNVTAVDFTEESSTEELESKVKEALEKMGAEETICFCDIAGGSPFRVCAGLKGQYNLEVIAGASAAMVIACLFERETGLADLSETAIRSGIEAIQKYQMKAFVQEENEDGI